MRRVLVVDDDEACRSSICLALEVRGFDVRAAGSRDAAVAIAASFEPQALLSDFQLGPGGNGARLVKELQACLPDLRAVIVSASDPNDVKAAIGQLDVPILDKPFRVDELLQHLCPRSDSVTV